MGTTDPEKLLSFIARARSALGPLVSLTIVGGEPFLHAEAFRRYLAAGVRVNTTTNGMFDFENVKDIIGRLFHLTFSIDGWPEQHNHARRALSPGTNPFLVAYRNLCRTIESFPDLDVNVQGSVIDDEVEDFESAFRYYALMLAAGVKRDRISLGPCAATLRRNSTVAFQRVATELTRKSPCCDHVTHKGFYVWNNKIYGSYYRLEEYPAIADLDDSMDVILYNKKQFILNTMPMLQDDVCMRECRAVGLCWGLCTNARHVFRDNKPSSVCDRVAKESKILETARQASVGTHGSCSGCSQPAECETLLPQGLL